MLDIDPDTYTGPLWTRERILSALGDWIFIHGAPPTGPELKRARAAELLPSHLKEWPTGAAIHKHFGSFAAAIEAAEAAQPTHFANRVAQFRADVTNARRNTVMRMNNNNNNAATSAQSPPLDLPPTAAELDPAPADPGICCTCSSCGNNTGCGQPRSNLVNTFSTGSRTNDPSLHIYERGVDSPLEPDGESAHRVRLMVREFYPQADAEPDAAERVLATIIHRGGDYTYNQIDGVVRAEIDRLRGLQVGTQREEV